MVTEIILLIILFIIMMAFFALKTRGVMSPWSATIGIWTIIMVSYLFVRKELYAISPDFVYGLALWVIGLSFSSYFAFRFFPSYKKTSWLPYEKHIDILTLLTLILVPFAVLKAVQHAMLMSSPDQLMLTLREQAISPEENQLGVVRYFVYVINVLLMLELDRAKIRKYRLALVIVFCLLFFIATMSKTTLLTYIFSGLYILYANKKISLKPIMFFGLFLVAMVPIMYIMRGTDDTDTDAEALGNILVVYILSSIVAFSFLTPCSSSQWGEITLRPFYNILHGLGFNVNVVDTIQDFVLVPLPTNVYTCLAPFYQDFGMIGIFCFSIIEGLIVGVIYKLSKTGLNIMKYLYAFIFTLLMTQFFDEAFFQAISAILQTLILVCFCHVRFIFKRKEK